MLTANSAVAATSTAGAVGGHFLGVRCMIDFGPPSRTPPTYTSRRALTSLIQRAFRPLVNVNRRYVVRGVISRFLRAHRTVSGYLTDSSRNVNRSILPLASSSACLKPQNLFAQPVDTSIRLGTTCDIYRSRGIGKRTAPELAGVSFIVTSS